MKTLIRKKKSRRGRLGAIGQTVSVHTAEAGHKIREEFDEVAPKAAAAASEALHTAAHTAAERSRPVRAEAASRGSAALAGLLGEVTPAQIEKMSGRTSRRAAKQVPGQRTRGKTVLLLATAGGAAMIWVMWWKRSEPNLDPWLEEVSDSDPEPVEGDVEGFVGT
jgi:hypothetical protein